MRGSHVLIWVFICVHVSSCVLNGNGNGNVNVNADCECDRG